MPHYSQQTSCLRDTAHFLSLRLVIFFWFVLSLMEQTFRIIFPVLWSLPRSFMGCYQHWWDLVCENWDKLIWIWCNWDAVVPRLDELCPRREVSGRNNICEQRHHLLRAVKCGLFGGKLTKQHWNHLQAWACLPDFWDLCECEHIVIFYILPCLIPTKYLFCRMQGMCGHCSGSSSRIRLQWGLEGCGTKIGKFLWG